MSLVYKKNRRVIKLFCSFVFMFFLCPGWLFAVEEAGVFARGFEDEAGETAVVVI